MDRTVFLFSVIFTASALAATQKEDFYIHNHSDDYDDYEYDDEVRNVQTDKPTSTQTKRPIASYEVTEKVDDIPNNVTYTPIRVNFTINLPLNNATIVNKTNINKIKDKDGIDEFFNGIPDGFDDEFEYPNENKVKKNLKKNSISIFHLNAEFDDNKDKKPAVQNININQLPNFGIFNVKDHVDRFKDVVVNHFHNINHGDDYDNVNNGFVLPNIVAGPIAFLNKLHRKGSAVASRLHNVIFGNFDDY